MSRKTKRHFKRIKRTCGNFRKESHQFLHKHKVIFCAIALCVTTAIPPVHFQEDSNTLVWFHNLNASSSQRMTECNMSTTGSVQLKLGSGKIKGTLTLTKNRNILKRKKYLRDSKNMFYISFRFKI